MTRYIAIKLADSIPTLLLVLTLVFIAMRILPGDPAIVALGDYATPEQLAAFRARMGLDQPLWQQFFSFLAGVLTLNFGNSLTNGQPVLGLLAYNLPYTLELTFWAMLFGIAAGIPMGVFAATNRNKLPDSLVRGYSLFGYAVPDFFLGALLLITLSLNLGLFPVSGAGGSGDFASRFYHVFLPAITLAAVKAAFVARLTRASLLEILGKDFIRTAKAKGANRRTVVYGHGLRNALLPLITGLGLSTLATLSGSVAIEMVFNRPGVGKMLINAIAERDYPIVQGGVITFALFVVLVNLLMDLLYTLVDPRVRM